MHPSVVSQFPGKTDEGARSAFLMLLRLGGKQSTGACGKERSLSKDESGKDKAKGKKWAVGNTCSLLLRAIGVIKWHCVCKQSSRVLASSTEQNSDITEVPQVSRSRTQQF